MLHNCLILKASFVIELININNIGTGTLLSINKVKNGLTLKSKRFPLFQDEILMVPLLGHSAGHCGIAIKQQNQWLLFCGDAYYSHLELNPANKLRSLSLLEKTFAEDNEKRLINLKITASGST